jgi:chemotaxis signal transduction protein
MSNTPLEKRLLTFRLGKRLFAVPLGVVSKVVVAGAIEPIPRSVPALMGVTVYRGGVLPVLSIPEALGIGGGAPGRLLVVVRMGKVEFGFPVDRTGEIVDWPAEQALERVEGEGALLGRFILHEKRCFILRLEKAFVGLLS